MMLIFIVPCQSLYVKHLDSILGEAMRYEELAHTIARVREEINKDLDNGKVPPKRIRDWFVEAKAIKHQAGEVISAQNNSSFLKSRELQNLKDRIILLLRNSPLDRIENRRRKESETKVAKILKTPWQRVHETKSNLAMVVMVVKRYEELSHTIARVSEEINKDLDNGKVPPKRIRDWFVEAKEIKHQAGEVKSALNNSSFLKSRELQNLNDRIILLLRKSPLDRIENRRRKESDTKVAKILKTPWQCDHEMKSNLAIAEMKEMPSETDKAKPVMPLQRNEAKKISGAGLELSTMIPSSSVQREAEPESEHEGIPPHVTESKHEITPFYETGSASLPGLTSATSIETTTVPKMTPPLGEDVSSVKKGKIDSMSSKAEGMPSFPSPREQILEEMPSGMKGPRSTHETGVDNTASSVAEREGRINPEQSEITIEPTVYETESASLPGLTSAPSIETPAMPKMTPPLGGDVSSVEKGKIDSISSKAEGMPSFPREEILEEMPSRMKGPRSTHETGVDNTASSVAEKEGRINPEQSEITIEPTVYETESASLPGLTSAPSIETPAMPKITPPLVGDVSSVEKGKVDSISSKAEGMPSFPREEILEEMPSGMKGPRSIYETRVDNTVSSVAEREGRINPKQSEITIEPTVSETTSIKIKWPFMHTELEIFQGASSVKLHDMNNDPGCFLCEADYYMSIRTSEKIEELTKMESDSSYIFKEDASLCGPLESPERTSFSLPEHSILRKAGAGLKEPPPETEWEQTSMVVLMDNEFSTLPKKPRCPNLAFLFLQRNNRLRTIPDLLFDDMASLRVLDLSNTRIRSLPPSLFKLTELQVLFLRKCDCLDELPHEVGDLQHLEVLDIWGTELYNLPDEIGKLICLKILQVSFYGSDDQIEYRNLPPKLVSDDIVSKLIVLEVLRIAVHPNDWRWNKSSEAITKNVSMLNNLTFLEFYFPEVKFLTHFIESSPSWRNRQLKFKFVVGQNIKRIVSRVPEDIESKYNHEDQSLRFVNGGKKLVEVVEVLERVTGFYLDHHLGICSLSEFGISNMLVLQFCLVRECPNIRVFIENEERSGNVLPSLRHLSIHYLWKLEIIWKGPMTHGSLGELKVLSVHTCPKLEFIISQSMLQGLSNLEELVVDDCRSVKEVIKWDENLVEGDINALPGLKKIKLHYLPELVSVCGVFPLLKQSDIYGCPKLPRLSVSSSTV